jgi:hypothetical protein
VERMRPTYYVGSIEEALGSTLTEQCTDTTGFELRCLSYDQFWCSTNDHLFKFATDHLFAARSSGRRSFIIALHIQTFTFREAVEL